MSTLADLSASELKEVALAWHADMMDADLTDEDALQELYDEGVNYYEEIKDRAEMDPSWWNFRDMIERTIEFVHAFL
jgi:hypothetical protein